MRTTLPSRDEAGKRWWDLGYLELATGNYSAAQTELEAARDGFAAAGDLYGETRSLAALGSLALHQERSDRAIPLLQQSLRLSRTLADLDDIAWALECGAAHGALAMTTPGDTSMASLQEVLQTMKGGTARISR